MSHKLKTHSEVAPCEKFIQKYLKHDMLSAKKTQPIRQFQDKFSPISKPPTPLNSQRLKPKTNVKSQSPIQKVTAHVINNVHKEPVKNSSPVRDSSRSSSQQCRSRSRQRSESVPREAWGQILLTNRSKEKVSSFSNFDPLRTLHFLSKELFTKLESKIPDEGEVLQMVTDIQHALKRIPPEVSTFLHNPNTEFPQLDVSCQSVKTTASKICQTPPTLYQEDTERFQKIMEENTYRLEASCKQLEEVCANLQNEKEMTEKELDEAKENVDILSQKVMELENQIEQMSVTRVKYLEQEKKELEDKLNRAIQESNNNPTIIHLTKLVDDLKKEKAALDQNCAQLEYDMTILKMEKEKIATMLEMRDKEIKEIQNEMTKIQEHVNKQLKRLNGEMIERVNSMKTLSEPMNGIPENVFLDIGDTTISSITTNESDKEPINVIKESPHGDAQLKGMTKESQDDFFQKLKADNMEKGYKKLQDPAFEKLLEGLTPSVQALLTSSNL